MINSLAINDQFSRAATLVVGLPLLFFVLGQGEAYVTWGPWISAIALMLWLLMDVDKIRRGGGR